jgi:Fe-S cluster biogenesis protein NfuA
MRRKMGTEKTPVVCQHCGKALLSATQGERVRVAHGDACQGCRAGGVLLRRPWLLAQFVSAWEDFGYPESASWLTRLQAERV